MPMASVFVDPLNPHERKRERDMPVGLKNIGNTCWFSAVIQVRLVVSNFACLYIFPMVLPKLVNIMYVFMKCF